MVMNGKIRLLICLLCLPIAGFTQEKPATWDLKSCIDYALAQNIQIKRSKVAIEESLENTKQAKARLFPSLSFSSGHNLVNHPKNTDEDKNSYTGSYGLNSSVSLYEGGKLTKNIQQQQLQDRMQELSIGEAENDIELAITENFLQVLYASEAVNINQNTLEVSEAQLIRSRGLFDAGSISSADLAQLESQYSADKYQLVVAQSALENTKLQLKQLLELGITDEMELVIPELNDGEVLALLPSKSQVYETSLTIMPQIKYNRLNVDVAGLEKAKAKAGYLPSLNLTAGIGTGHVSGTDFSFSSQMKKSFNESVGVTLSVPVFSNRANKTAVKLAELKIEDSQLNYQSVQKDLLKTVETIYLDAVSSQDRYKAAKESLHSAQLSYRLTEEQFYLGIKNTLELLTEKNKLLTAQQEVIQAKYMAILNQQLLNFYQGKEIVLK